MLNKLILIDILLSLLICYPLTCEIPITALLLVFLLLKNENAATGSLSHKESKQDYADLHGCYIMSIVYKEGSISWAEWQTFSLLQLFQFVTYKTVRYHRLNIGPCSTH